MRAENTDSKMLCTAAGKSVKSLTRVQNEVDFRLRERKEILDAEERGG